MADRRLRVAVTGSAGTGKTTLAAALAPALGLPLVPEEMREHLVRDGRPLTALAVADRRETLRALWARRRSAEDGLRGFVADNCAADFAAYALHHGCVDEGGGADLLEEALGRLAGYDAILVLPWGAIPYQRDGIRSPNPHLELRYQLVLEALLRDRADARRVHLAPVGMATPSARLAWALDVCRRAATPPAAGAARAAGGASGPAEPGVVYLVGAGPGDPGLLTLRAAELLRSADVVAHDELVPPAVLALARPGAERLAVGRRCHGSSRHPLKLHPAVLDRARAGRSVVRLKAGDPLVFGRGGEEAEELAAAGVRLEIVPGVSAALGAAARAAIPLTYRDVSSDVTFATGHDLTRGGKASRTDWAKLAGSGTLVLYMASRSLGANLARLVEQGRSAATPAAWIAAATRPEQQVVIGTLGDLAARVAGREGDAPALVIVGEVVALRERLLALAATAAARDERRRAPRPGGEGGVEAAAPGDVAEVSS